MKCSPAPLVHAMLARQLGRLGINPHSGPPSPERWQALLALIGNTYEEYEQLVYLVTRAERMSTDELQRSQSALAEAERIAGLGSWTWRPGDEMLLISPTLASLMQLPASTRELPLVLWLAGMDGADRVLLHDSLRRATRQAVSLCGELRLQVCEGQQRWMQYHIVSRPDPEQPGALAVSGTLLDITERMRAEEQVRTLAFQDPLTGLCNRARFFDLLGSARNQVNDSGEQFALLFLDLDGFKEINDRHGHDAGDQLLRQVAERLRHTVPPHDPLCRFGGDEFLVLIHANSAQDTLEALAQQILVTISEPFDVDGRRLSVGVSIGIALYPRDAMSTLDLVRAADTAMYQAKQQGKGRVEFHRPARTI
ncbi:sensor domain-containing diguanylate cyclase [Sphaerotilus sp.]|uniref:sensor domain-containing diguanylate cyclase n=1 Tax=Sphaerotilus sp. TaxID=2093942 RepID=UPI00286DB09F|nr:sensor domain-containing diguanylate cyclase [Sphaerotilus sp.]